MQASENDIKSLQTVFDQADCLYTHDQVVRAIDKTAIAINQALADKNPLILVLMNGGLVFAGQLLSRLSFPMELDYVHATRYGSETQGQSLEWRVKPVTPLTNRCVLILDDILDEGKTLVDVISFCEHAGANEVYTAVLANKLHQRKCQVNLNADFCALEVVDRFVFGFGMDYQGYWRNAPGIYAVKGL